MKKLWTLVAAAAVLAALIGGYFVLSSRPKAGAKAPESTTVTLSKLDPARLVKIRLTRPSGVLAAQKKGTEWKLDYPYPIQLNQGNMDDLISSFTDLSADRVIQESPADLAAFGLAPPRAVAEATLDDGTVKTFSLGDRAPSGTGYYLQVKGDPRVYSVWTGHGDHFMWTVSDLREKTLGPAIKADEVTSLVLRGRSGSTIELRAKTDAEKKTFQLGFGAFLMLRPYPYPVGVDSEKGGPFLDSALGLSIGEFIDDDPRSLARYGLELPWGELAVRGKNGSLDVLFGADTGTDKVFFKLKSRRNVYALEKSRISFMNTKPFDLIDRFAFIPGIDDVDRLEITADGKTRAMTLSRTVKKAEKAGEEDETVTAYTVDGKAADESSFKKFYQALIGLSVEGEATRKVAARPDVTTRFFLNKGELREAVVTYVPYDRDFDAVFVNGRGAFALTHQQLEKMLGKLEALARGETVTD